MKFYLSENRLDWKPIAFIQCYNPIIMTYPRIIPVRSLVEFVLQSGDITPGGFQRRDHAQLGSKGHRQVQRNRPEGYESEFAGYRARYPH